MSTATPSDPCAPQPDAPRKPRLWIPLAIIALEIAGLAGVQYAESAEMLPPAEAFLFKFSTVGLGTILLFLWFVVLGPAARTVRIRVGMVGVLAIVGLVGLVRIDNVSGDIVPKLRFRFSPRADELLPKVSGQADSASPVDLKTTTPVDWPQFLGKDRLATLDKVEFDRDWTARPPKLLWRQPIGAGWSSYAVVGHFAVTQEQRGEDELVTCYDIDDGKLQWAQSTDVRFAAAIAGVGPRSTPTIDEGNVYTMGSMGDVYCLDGGTGKVIWHHDVVKENDAEVPKWGKSCSPLIHENLCIVSAGGPDGHSLVAYDKATGKLAWRAGDDASSYASPTLMTLGGKPQIVMINQKLLTAHDPADGRILWEHPWPEAFVESPNVAQPVAIGDDRILLTKGYGIGSALWQVKHDGDDWQIEEVWKGRNLKTKFTNAVVRDGYAYGLDEDVLACIDLSNGKRKWMKGRYNHGQVLLVGDLLLVQSETGDVALVEAKPEAYREIARFEAVKGQSWNYPVLVGRKLLVRTEEQAACYELPAAE